MSAIGINTFAMVGRLTGDAVYKAIGTDSSLLSFSLAQTRGWGDKQHPLFMPCKMWGKTAATLQNYMTKGQQVACSGNLDQDDWMDDAGQKRTRVYFNVTQVELLSKPKQTTQPDAVDPTTSEMPGW